MHLRRVQKFQLGKGIITRHGVISCQSIFKLVFFSLFLLAPCHDRHNERIHDRLGNIAASYTGQVKATPEVMGFFLV